MDIAALGIRIDSDGTVTASQRLDKLTASATKTESVTGSLARMALNTDRSTRALGAGVNTVNGSLAAMASNAANGVNGLNTVAGAATKAQANMSRMGGSMSGLAAQFQDIGVTAAMGMNPVMIALQQGTQIAGQMEMAMQSGGSALGVLGTAFKSLISPVAIVSIALTAVAAAGLQMVDWTGVAAGGLNLVADGLVAIAPYATVAAGGLALLYSPALIGGIGTLIGSLGGIAKGVVGIGAAIYGVVGLPALLVAGFAAMVAGAVIWRDDLTKMLGVDIVGAAQTGINWIVGAFVGGFNGIKETWSALPAAIGDLVVQAANNALEMIENLLNSAGNMINDFLKPYNDGLALMGQRQLPTVGEVKFGRFDNPWEDEAKKVGDAITSSMSSAIGPDYVGGGIKGIQDFASGAADALRDLADGLGTGGKLSKEAAKELERQAKAYADLTRGAEQFISAQTLEQQALGMTAEAAARMRYEQDLLNKAANDNIKLSSGQRSELMGLAAQMAAVEEATRRVTEIYNFGKDVFTGFFGDLKSGITEGKSLWESLGNAAANALDKIADRALSMAANGIFDMIFGAVMGGIGGNSLGGGWGIAGGFGKPGIFGIPGFDAGGYTGNMATNAAAGIVHGQEFVLNAAATRNIGLPTLNAMNAGYRPAANQNQANDNGTYNFNMTANMQIMPGATEADGAAFARGWQAEMKRWQSSGEGSQFVNGVVNKSGRY